MKGRKKLGVWLLLMLLVFCSLPVTEVSAFSAGSALTQELMTASGKTGWVKKGSYWYYYKKGKLLRNQWLTNKGKKYYLKSDGKMAVGWTTIKGKKYYFNTSGAMQTRWVNYKGAKYYCSIKDGAMITKKFVKNSKGQTYYFQANGKMATGLMKIGQYYRYFGSDGIMTVGWRKIDGKWYYFNKAGVRRVGLVIDNGKRYYMGKDGVMQTGWMTVKGHRYYADPKTGALTIGWKRSGKGNTYHFGSTGKQSIGLTKISGKYYYFDKKHNGIMLVNGWADGRYFGSDGAYIPNYTAASDMRWPLDSRWNTISSYFGNRESPGGIGSTNHMGIDIPANTGAKIYAAAAGTIVIRQANNPSAGNYIEINHGKSLNTQYMHMSRFASGLTVGSKVKKGQVIGYVGSTGNSTGPHLHFGVKRYGVYQNPLNYVKEPS